MSDDSDGKTLTFWFPTGYPREREFWNRLKNRGAWIVGKIQQELNDDPDQLEAELREKLTECKDLEERIKMLRTRKPAPVKKDTNGHEQFFYNFPKQVEFQAREGNEKKLKELENTAVEFGMDPGEVRKTIDEARRRHAHH
jgi:hypothetical protein